VIRTSLTSILIVAAALSDASMLRASMNAMTCCASTHNKCAGIRTPDDCCRSMGQSVGDSVSTVPSVRNHEISLAGAILPEITAAVTAGRSVHLLVDHGFKRPHDPPHLHPVPLLI
jgi:hypothetical protein